MFEKANAVKTAAANAAHRLELMLLRKSLILEGLTGVDRLSVEDRVRYLLDKMGGALFDPAKVVVIEATPFSGKLPLTELQESITTTPDLPSNAIGECVAIAIHKAMQAGYHPANAENGFSVVVKLEIIDSKPAQ